MNENAKKLVEALRSGEYEQGTGVLRSTNNRFCCLGVACDISGLGEWRHEPVEGVSPLEYTYHVSDETGEESDAALPKSVCEWLGFNTRLGGYEGNGLSGKNDRGETFEEIAALIESEPPGLFAE